MSFFLRLSTQFERIMQMTRRQLGYEKAKQGGEAIMTMQIRHGEWAPSVASADSAVDPYIA
jgi:hypothetical protein